MINFDSNIKFIIYIYESIHIKTNNFHSMSLHLFIYMFTITVSSELYKQCFNVLYGSDIKF